MQYWTALEVLKQVSGELGLPQTTDVASSSDLQTVQLRSLLNSAGNELLLYYPWQQFRKEWVFDTVIDQGEYDLPADWNYPLDQTQWDRTDHWPLIGPKTAQEWAWLKGGLLAAAPRLRFRIDDNKFKLWPVPSTTTSPSQYEIAQEYIVRNWVLTGDPNPIVPADMVVANTDIIQYEPWLINKYLKLKWYQLKGFETSGVESDFMRIFNSLTGKDTGAPILSMAPQNTGQFLGPWSVPDGSWSTGQP